MKRRARVRTEYPVYLNLRRARLEANLTMQDVAEWCGVTRQWIYYVETIKKKPSKELLIDLSMLFSRSEDWLMQPDKIGFDKLADYCPECGRRNHNVN